MAYAATVTVTRRTISGRRHYTVEVTETEAAAASEWSTAQADDLPAIGTITHFQATLTAGSAATIQPRLGKATGWANDTQGEITRQSTAAAHINDAGLVRYSIPEGTVPRLFGRSTVNAGADNTVVTIIEIVEGHLP